MNFYRVRRAGGVEFNLVESHPESRIQESEYSIDSQQVMCNFTHDLWCRKNRDSELVEPELCVSA